MRALIALLLLTPALVGCLGASDEALSPSAADGAAGEVSRLPPGLEMERAEVVDYNETNVLWSWRELAPPGITNIATGPIEGPSTSFDVPAGSVLTISANVTPDTPAALGLRVIDADGRTRCTVDGLFDAPTCTARVQPALENAERWTVVVDTYSKLTPVAFELLLSLRLAEPERVHSVAEMVPFETTAEDGTPLRGHVYLPDGDGPFGTVLELSPYWNTHYWESEDAAIEGGNGTTLRGWSSSFLEAGFAVAFVNMRGTGESAGCLDFGGAKEISDARVVIEALATASWSNGKVGMFGLSWPAWTQYMALASGAPSLEAVVPVSGLWDYWSLVTRNGAAAYAGEAPFLHAFGPSGWYNWPVTGVTPDNVPEHYACPHAPAHYLGEQDMLLDGDRNAWFSERDLRPGIAESSAAVLYTHGLINAEQTPYTTPDLWEVIPHDDKRAMLGQWDHGYPHQQGREDFLAMTVDWYEQYLLDGQEAVEPGVVEYQDTAGNWHVANSWPPKGQEARLSLSNGRLAPSADDAVRSEQVFQSVDRRALPDDCPGGKALFVSPPLAEEVLIAGVYRANLTVSSTLPDGNFAANLWHMDGVWACGQAPGAQGRDHVDPPLEAHEVALALSDLRHRGHLEQGSDFPTQAPDVMRMTSESFATLVPAGAHLALAVGGGDPLLTDDPRKPILTVHTGPDVEGELVLNVVEGNLTFEDEEPVDRTFVEGVVR